MTASPLPQFVEGARVEQLVASAVARARADALEEAAPMLAFVASLPCCTDGNCDSPEILECHPCHARRMQFECALGAPQEPR